MLESYPSGTLRSGKPILREFTGEPVYRSSIQPSLAAQGRRGWVKPKGWLWVCFGTVVIAPAPNPLRRAYVE
jgi:hypothetical protein